MSVPAPDSGTIRLDLLGATRLNAADGTEATRVLQQPKRLALLAWLVVRTSGFARRDALLATFWPELDAERARSALRQSVHFLRQQLGAGAIVNRGDEDLGIHPTAFRCDVWDFEAALAKGRQRDALAVYRGDLLPGFFLSGVPAFEQWLELERSRLRERAVALAWDLSSSARSEPERVALAHQAVALAPDDEAGVRRLMELLSLRGERATALRLYESLEERLRTEEDTPEEATRQLAAGLRHGIDVVGGGRKRRRMVLAPQLPELLPTARGWSPQGKVVVAAGLLLLTAAAALVVIRRPAAVALDPNLVIVAPFDVYDTSHAIWREGLASILAANLDGAGPLRTVPASTVIRAWTGTADPTQLREAATRHGAGLAISGRLLPEGRDSVRLTALVLHSPGRGATEVFVRGTADRMDLLSDSLTMRVLRHLSSTQPIAAVRRATIRSPSLPVLKAYLQGEQYYRHSQWDSALAMFRVAADEDSTFAPALLRVANVMTWIGTVQDDSSGIYKLRAGRFNRGLAARETLLIRAESLFASLMDGREPDLDWWRRRRRMYQVLDEARQRYPSDPEIRASHGEALFHAGGHPATSLRAMLEDFDSAIALDTAFGPAYIHPVGLATRLGDPDRARVLAAAYMRHSGEGVTREGIGAFLAVAGASAPAQGYPALTRLADPSAMFEAWAPLHEVADSAATVVMRRLAAGTWADPPFSSAEFRSTFLFRTLARRGRLREAFALPHLPPDVAGREVAALGVLAMHGLYDAVSAAPGRRSGPSRDLLPLWAARRDTAAIQSFARLVRRERTADTAYTAAAVEAYLAVARGDTAAALRRFEAVPDSLCPACVTERLAHAALLASSGRVAAAQAMLEAELAPIPREGMLGALYWDLLRGTIAEQVGERARARRSYSRVAGFLMAADPEFAALRARATAGLARVRERIVTLP